MRGQRWQRGARSRAELSDNLTASGSVEAARRARRTAKRRGTRALMAAALVPAILSALAGTLASGAAVSPKASMSHAATLKPDLAFFRGKTLTILNGNVGGTPDLMTRAITAQLATYLHATVIDQNMPGQQSLEENAAAASSPDGLTLGVLGVQSTLAGYYLGTNAVNYSVQKATYIAGGPPSTDLMVSCLGSPYTSWQQMLASTTPVSVVNYQAGTVAVPLYLLLQAYGTPSRFISGYTSTSQPAGCLRGDGNIAGTSVQLFENSSLTALNPGFAPLLLWSPIPRGSATAYLNKQVPLLSQYAAKHPPKTAAGRRELAIAVGLTDVTADKVFFGPPGIPANRVLALTDAFKYAMNSAAARQAFVNLGLKPGFLPGSLAPTELKFGIKKEASIIRLLAQPT